MACKLFISYSSRNNRRAREVRDALRIDGVSCWMAREMMKAGQSHPVEIPRAIRESDAVVLVLSRAADESRYVQSEIGLAFTAGKTIVPVRIQNCQPVNLLLHLTGSQMVECHGKSRAKGEHDLQEFVIGLRGPLPAPPPRRRSARKPDETLARAREQFDQDTATSAQRMWDLAMAACQGRRPDFPDARYWFTRAAEAGRKDGTAERRAYERGAAAGHVEAMVSLGRLLEHGIRVPLDRATAKGWYEKAAKSGSAEAMCRLGVMAMNGDPPRITPNYRVAEGWLRQAVALGSAAAMQEMGNWFERKHDRQNAQMWFAKASARSRALARKKTGLRAGSKQK